MRNVAIAVGTHEGEKNILARIPPLATAVLAVPTASLSSSLLGSLSSPSWAMATAARKERMNLESCILSWKRAMCGFDGASESKDVIDG